ncbi:hypothetical protein [Spiroplasma endosymbiont of Polydrusus pterygomalis]|uniref:hypothetical protein n=1 Tax=Spiroplasma endosymbiont of Polydrusus pterygomalis TaxID=3139327 RepID=UPI003CCA70ED
MRFTPIIGYWLNSNLVHAIGNAISNINNKCFPKNTNDINNTANERTSLLENKPEHHSITI